MLDATDRLKLTASLVQTIVDCAAERLTARGYGSSLTYYASLSDDYLFVRETCRAYAESILDCVAAKTPGLKTRSLPPSFPTVKWLSKATVEDLVLKLNAHLASAQTS